LTKAPPAPGAFFLITQATSAPPRSGNSGSADDEQPGRFDIVGHIDVVPAGTGWEHDPFVMREQDGFLFGRGTSDDKGPVVASLFAMKALKEEGAIVSPVRCKWAPVQ
jgi:acetylornithine deacetylase/succinyl-diaminopimelate desuccinylase-like protein